VHVGDTEGEAYRDSGIDTMKDEANPRSNESERHKRQALANKKITKIRRQCMEKGKTKWNIGRVNVNFVWLSPVEREGLKSNVKKKCEK